MHLFRERHIITSVFVLFMGVVSPIFLLPANAVAETFYVSPQGNDSDLGTFDQPWRTIQKAADSVGPGSTVNIRGGIYNEEVFFGVSGSANGGNIVFQNHPGETAILDGSGFNVSEWSSAMIYLEDKSYITIKGLEIRNYKTSTHRLPMAIVMQGSCHHIQIKNNRIHDIDANYSDLAAGGAHGIGVYGNASTPMNNIEIEGNELYNLKLGGNEAITFNGNITQFKVVNNTIHDIDNIAIDAIGHAGLVSDPNQDRARDGLIQGNTIYNLDSFGNPAYGNRRSAPGIYVDGGHNIVIKDNIVHDANFGIAITSERQGKVSSNVTVSNNALYNNHVSGMSIGGFNLSVGGATNISVVNNTFFGNDAKDTGNGELIAQYFIQGLEIKNNIFYSRRGTFLRNYYRSSITNDDINNNIYFTQANQLEWQWNGDFYSSLADYQQSTGNDLASEFINPGFLNDSFSAFDFDLKGDSPARARNIGAVFNTAPPPSPNPAPEPPPPAPEADTSVDTDGDGVLDDEDNCTELANENQIDSDSDGFGNSCDADVNNDGNTGLFDLALYKQAFGSRSGDSVYNADVDFDSDGQVGLFDLSILKMLYGKAPGPSCCR